MAPPKNDVPPPVKSEGDTPGPEPEHSDQTAETLAQTNNVSRAYDSKTSTSYGPIDWSNPSLAPFAGFTLYSGDVTGSGTSISPEAQATLAAGMEGLSQSMERTVAVNSLARSTEAAAIAGNYEQLAQNLAQAYTKLKDDPASFRAFRDTLKNRLKDDHITVDGGVGNGVVGLLLHKEGTATGLEIVASEGADGNPVVTGHGYEFQNNHYLEGSPESSARDLSAASDPVLEANQALAFSRNMPDIKAMDTDGNGRVGLQELRNYKAKTHEEQAAKEYMITHFNSIARTTGTENIDLSKTDALGLSPTLQHALIIAKEQVGDLPMTKEKILEAKGQWGGNHPNPRILRELDLVLQNFDALRIATAPPGSLGISQDDRVLSAARAAVRGLSESVLRATKNGSNPTAEVSLDSIIHATNNPQQMAKWLPAIVNATNESILSTPYRFETSSVKGTSPNGKPNELIKLRVEERVGGLQAYVAKLFFGD